MPKATPTPPAIKQAAVNPRPFTASAMPVAIKARATIASPIILEARGFSQIDV